MTTTRHHRTSIDRDRLLAQLENEEAEGWPDAPDFKPDDIERAERLLRQLLAVLADAIDEAEREVVRRDATGRFIRPTRVAA